MITTVCNTLTCLFGFHDYSNKLTWDKNDNSVHLCKICKRSGYVKYSNGNESWNSYNEEGNRVHTRWNGGTEHWYGYNKEGNLIYEKWTGGTERWFDEIGNMIHMKWRDGYEVWKSNNGHWVTKKPKNWKYEKQI